MIRNLGTLGTIKKEKIVQGKKQISTYYYINSVLMTAPQGKKRIQPLTTNWCEVIITNLSGKKLYHNSFITNIPLHANNVIDIAGAGRTRWKKRK